MTQASIDQSLREAVIDGNLRLVKRLVTDYSGDINSQDSYGTTSALLAAKVNNMKILSYLVEEGADLRNGDNMGVTPLDWARKNKNEEMIDFIETSIPRSMTI